VAANIQAVSPAFDPAGITHPPASRRRCRLTRADADDLLELEDEDLAVAHLPGPAPSQSASIVGSTNSSDTAISKRTLSDMPTRTVVPR
jgi:hypothetical protein